MSAPPQATGEPVTSKDDLVAYVEAGCKPPTDWRIGTEHEKFAYTCSDLRRLPYAGERGIQAMLEGLAGVREALGGPGASENAAREILATLGIPSNG